MEIKPGYKTTEFWMTVVTAVITLLIGYGIMSSEEGELWLGLVAALLPAVIAVASYSISRSIVKK
jgi:uncharacterized membrane protein YccC